MNFILRQKLKINIVLLAFQIGTKVGENKKIVIFHNMPPKLFKLAFLGEDDYLKRCTKDNRIRTDFILENVFSYLLQDFYEFDAICAINDKETNTLNHMKKILRTLKESSKGSLKSLCFELDDINEDKVGSILLGVAHELFSEGITWSRITAFIIFVGELTIMCLSQKLPTSIVDAMYESFSRLVKEKLETWIEDHNHWEGIFELSVENNNQLKESNWAKVLWHTTVRIVGTLASVSNVINNSV